METLAERVIRLREAKGWKQKDLIRESGAPQSTVASIENGDRSKAPSSIVEIAHALGVDAYYLKTGEGSPRGPCREFSKDEELLLAAFPLLDKGTRRSWLLTAEDVIEQDGARKQSAA